MAMLSVHPDNLALFFLVIRRSGSGVKINEKAGKVKIKLLKYLQKAKKYWSLITLLHKNNLLLFERDATW